MIESELFSKTKKPDLLQLIEYRVNFVLLEANSNLTQLIDKAKLKIQFEQLITDFKYYFAIPLAVDDALKIFTASRLGGMRNPEIDKRQDELYRYRPNLAEGFRYALALRREGNGKAEKVISASVEQFVSTIEKRIQREKRERVDQVITIETLNEEGLLQRSLDRFLQHGLPITIRTENDEQKNQIQIAVTQYLESKGIDPQGIKPISEAELRPYNVLNFRKIHGAIETESQANYLENFAKIQLDRLKILARSFDKFLRTVGRNKDITPEEKQEIVIEIFEMLGARDEGQYIVDQINIARETGEKFDISPLVEKTAQACCSLRMVSKSYGQNFALTVAEAAGLSKRKTAQLLHALENRGVRMNVLNAPYDFLRIMLDENLPLAIQRLTQDSAGCILSPFKFLWEMQFKLLDLPDPFTEPDKFFILLGDRVKDLIWLYSFAGIVTNIYDLPIKLMPEGALKDIWEANFNVTREEMWSALHKVIWIQLLSSFIPRTGGISFDAEIGNRFMQKANWFPGNKYFEAFFKLFEGLGIGVRPANWSREVRVKWANYVKAKPGATDTIPMSVGKYDLYFPTRPNPDHTIYVYQPAGARTDSFGNPILTNGRNEISLSEEPIQFSKRDSQISVGADQYIGWASPFGFLHPLENFVNNRILAGVSRWVQREAFTQKSFMFGPHGYRGESYTVDVPYAIKLRYGLKRFITSAFPYLSIYMVPDQNPGTEISHIAGGPDQYFEKKIQRTDPIFHSHTFGNFYDYNSSLGSIFLTWLALRGIGGENFAKTLSEFSLHQKFTDLITTGNLPLPFLTTIKDAITHAALLPIEAATLYIDQVIKALANQDLGRLYSSLANSLDPTAALVADSLQKLWTNHKRSIGEGETGDATAVPGTTELPAIKLGDTNAINSGSDFYNALVQAGHDPQGWRYVNRPDLGPDVRQIITFPNGTSANGVEGFYWEYPNNIPTATPTP